jgi:hypothetical protein
MNISILHVQMKKIEGEGYEGAVQFQADKHQEPYEVTLYSKDGRDWMYSLHFARESGKEEDIQAVEEWLEQDDEGFDELVEAAMNALA